MNSIKCMNTRITSHNGWTNVSHDATQVRTYRLLEELGEGGSIGVGLLDGLVEQDDTADVLLIVSSGEQQLTVGLTVSLDVLDSDLRT